MCKKVFDKIKSIFKKKVAPQIFEANLIPKPYGYQPMGGYFTIDKDTILIVDKKRGPLADLFKEMFKKAFGHELYVHYNSHGYNEIYFEDNPALDIEGYILEIYPDRMKISAGGEPGFYYALQSIRQMIALDTLIYEDTISLPCMIISDAPRYRYRSFMIDVARHFFGKTEIKRYIDIASQLKLNTFHWHLSDDQGFRVEMDRHKFINMTSTTRDCDCIGKAGSEVTHVEKPYKGYYLKDEIKEIVAYAKDRFVTIVPEICLLGHVQALIAAYPVLACKAERVPVMTEYGGSRKIFCPGKLTTHQFIQDILDEVFELFDGPYIHIGVDDIDTSEWEDCADCARLMKLKRLKNVNALKRYFINTIVKYCHNNGKKVIGWSTGVTKKVDKNVVSQYCTEDPLDDFLLAEQVRAGRSVIVSAKKGFSADLPYAEMPLRDTYFYKLPEALVEAGIDNNIFGYEMLLWTEYIPDREKADMNLFPRLLALSELAWTRQQNPLEDLEKNKKKKEKLIEERYQRFLKRVKGLEGLLDIYRLNYAEPLIADPVNKKYRQIECKKWHGTDKKIACDQYSELRLNKNLKLQKKQIKENQKKQERMALDQQLAETLQIIETAPIKTIVTDAPYDKTLTERITNCK